MSEARYLEPDRLRAWRPEGASHLRVEVRGERTILSVRLKRLFPFSHPDGYISVQDGADDEVGVLRTLHGLDRETAELFESELQRRYFTPRISRIVSLRQDAGMWRFNVETQRGEAQFYVRNWRDSSQEIARGRWQILSVDGQRFEVPAIANLDARSQALLEQLI